MNEIEDDIKKHLDLRWIKDNKPSCLPIFILKNFKSFVYEEPVTLGFIGVTMMINAITVILCICAPAENMEYIMNIIRPAFLISNFLMLILVLSIGLITSEHHILAERNRKIIEYNQERTRILKKYNLYCKL